MKCLIYILLLMICGLSAHAQVEPFGEVGVSLGTGRYFQHSAGGFQLGGTMHGMAGLQYGIFALNAGLGFVMLSDKPSERNFASYEVQRVLHIDFPVGAAIRFPLDNIVLAMGADISGFLGGNGGLLLQPHIDVLFYGANGDRGFFFKGITSLNTESPNYQPQYFGVGFKAAFD